jgi:aspartyl-tRNA synthetase
MKKNNILDVLKNENQEIELIGWVDSRRDHGKLVFIDLRDKTGIVQVVFGPEIELAKKLRLEYLIKLNGVVKRRPEKLINPKIQTGEFEVEAKNLEIISESKELPIPLDTLGYEINEETRLKYRYLDLRRKRLTQNILIRSKIIKFIRDFMHSRDFVEIETPIISKSTPEGARDYLIPSRVFPGKFYALPQSPQQYKQLLMVSGFEKYFQIAKCFRDEDTRGDRQPEFTQLDIEMSFISEDEVLNLIEELYIELVKKFYPNKKIKQIPFPRLNYWDVMEKYNSDKPDLREDKNNPDELAFAFIVNFPMFEWKENEKRWDAVHHPFTKPKVKDIFELEEKFKENPGNILAYQYDIVLNGYEIGGGSIRINDPLMLLKIFELLGHKKEEIELKFGHLLEAFSYGAPPHGGIALGFDRILSILENEPNIREVIPFPKTGDGYDVLMNAPSEVDEEQLKELKILIQKNEEEL